LREVQRAHEAYASALSALKKANVELGEKVAARVAKISRAELHAYMLRVVACIQVAAALYYDCPDLPLFRIAKNQCKLASETFRVAREDFETTAGEGEVGIERFAAHTKALAAFVDSISEVHEMVATAVIGGTWN
jgi:hypothetical protein